MNMKKFILILFFNLFFFSSSFADIDKTINEGIEKEFENYKEGLEKFKNRIDKLKQQDLNEAKIIDQSLSELTQLLSFTEKNLDLSKQEELLDSLKVMDKYLGDISKVVPNEFSKTASEEDNENIDENTLKVMTNIGTSMKSKRAKKTSDILISMNNLEENGLNIYSVNQKLTDLDVSTIGLNEINAALNSENAILNEGDRKETIDNLKTGGLKDEDLVKIIDPPVIRPVLPPQDPIRPEPPIDDPGPVLPTPDPIDPTVPEPPAELPSYQDLDPNTDRLRDFATLRTLQNYDYSWETNDYRISVGRPVDEALEVKQSVYDEAINFGFSEDRANMLANNAYSAYYDMWFHGSEIAEQTRAAGGSWEEADEALEKWLLDPNNRYNEWALNFYKVDEGDEDEYLPNPDALKEWFSKIGDGQIEAYELSKDRLDKEAMARTVSYLTQDFMPGQGDGEGDPYAEADEVNEFVRNLALDKGFTDEQANILGKNAASTYLDIWLDGTYVMEKALAAGLSYAEADQAVERWAVSGEHGYNEWFERWGEADPEKDWMPDENTFGAYLDSIKGNTIELRDPSEIRKDLEVSMKVYENLSYNTDTLQWEGDVFSEADKVSQAFYDRAIEIGLTEDQARVIQINNRNAYIDTWMEGTYVYQEKIYEGYSSEEADQYVDSWFNQSRYNDYWTSNESNWNIEIIEDDEGNITVVVRPLTLEERIQMGENQQNLQVIGDVSTDKLKENLTEQVILKDEVGISAEALADAGISQEDFDEFKEATAAVGNTISIIGGELKQLNIFGEVMADPEILSAAQEAARDAAAEAGQALAAANDADAGGSDPGAQTIENDPTAGTCLGCKYIDPKGD